MLIRRATNDDILAVKEIEIETGLSPWSEQDYREELRREDSFFVVAESDGEVVGFMLTRLITKSISPLEATAPTLTQAEIYNIAVTPKFHRRQAATRLLQALLREAGRALNFTITLEVRTRNAKAIRFYLSQGFRNIGARRNFYTNPPDDAFVMIYDSQYDQNTKLELD